MRKKTTRTTVLTRVISFVLSIALVFSMLLAAPSITVNAQTDKSTAIGFGIDVSRYQGDINWAQVAASGVQFAIIRVGSVKWGMDKKFIKNITEANAVGIKCGVYIYSYAHSVPDVINEANWVAQQIAPYTISFPVAIDIEDDIQKVMSKEEQAAMADAFCAVIEAYGYYPIVYGSKSWFNNYMGEIHYDKWIAQYNSYCARDDGAIWQNSSTGQIPGIGTNVDTDYLYKDFSQYIIANGFINRKGYYYFYQNYKMVVNSFIPVNGVGIYYVDEYGRMITGMKQIGDGIFYFSQAGVMQVGLQAIGEKLYYFGTDGKMTFGAVNVGGKNYYFDPDGSMHFGWLLTNEGAFFYDADGSMAFGLKAIGDSFYYFNDKGIMTTGWVLAGENRYYFDPATGKLVTGLFAADGYLYYADPATGIMTKGFVTIGTDNYFFDLADGHMWADTQVVGNGVIYVIAKDGKVTIVPM